MSDEPLSPAVRSLRDALAASGLHIGLEQRLLAVHGDGRMVIAVFLVVGARGASEIATLFLHPAYLSVTDCVRQVDGPEIGDVRYVVYARIGDAEIRIQPDRLPPEAFLKLQGQLPAAPSGQIDYNFLTGQWQDSAELMGLSPPE